MEVSRQRKADDDSHENVEQIVNHARCFARGSLCTEA
jgi:hypothetical protein